MKTKTCLLSVWTSTTPRQGMAWIIACIVLALPRVGEAGGETPVPMAGLKAAARVIRDANGIAHISAQNDHDLFFLQGWVHAEDRLFQMDYTRRLASGRLAELLGENALPTDVLSRALGLHRAAERMLTAASPRVRAVLEAYAAGVNAFVATHGLPLEYSVLELTRFEPWTALDTAIVGKAFTANRALLLREELDQTSALMSYQQVGEALGFNGTALYFEDLFRASPFEPAATLPDGSGDLLRMPEKAPHAQTAQKVWLPPSALKLCREYLDSIRNLTIPGDIFNRERGDGSNEWSIDCAHTTSGHPMLANDTHLALGIPGPFYPIHLQSGRINAAGSSIPGLPFVVLGQNQRICWGGTVNYVDVSDIFLEQIVPDATSPSGLSTVHRGQNEPVIPIPEVFRKNNFDGMPDNVTVVPPGGGIPPVTYIVPRRNNGPIINLDAASGTALSVQYTGFSATREFETFLIWDEARGLEDFLNGLKFFDVGSINWAYADVHGNIGFFCSSEVPLREDLQAGTVQGSPPWVIRNGTGGNEWLPVQHPQSGQAVPYEILPYEEMPHLINPARGWFVNCNNDPLGDTFDNDPLNQLRPGGGIRYLSSFYETFRAARVTELVQEKLSQGGGKISLADMRQIQADTALIDARVFMPYVLQAYANAQSSAEPALAIFAGDARLAEAVRRLAAWDFTTPTGIAEGYDSSDDARVLAEPSAKEIAASVAATIYSVWRGQFLRNTIDAPLAPAGLPVSDDYHAPIALRHLLETFPSRGGVGASGLNFFNVPGVASADDRRDILILKSLTDTLTLLAGDAFAPAFAHSENFDDYRWGRLHRIVLAHNIPGPFDVPPALGAWPDPLPGLRGIPVDGGFATVDVGSPIGGLRGASADAFMFDHGPGQRFIAEATPQGVRAELIHPGGPSGVPGSPDYLTLLGGWLSNDSVPLIVRRGELSRNAALSRRYVPAR